MFMSSCTFFVFLSLIEYAFVNVMMGDIRWKLNLRANKLFSSVVSLSFEVANVPASSEIERKDRGAHLKSLVTHQKFLKNVKKFQQKEANNVQHEDAYRETQLVPSSSGVNGGEAGRSQVNVVIVTGFSWNFA